MANLKKEEYLKNNTKIKEVYNFIDEKEGIDILCREVYKSKALEIHFPFDKKGKQKYKYIESIEFHEIDPDKINGVYKSANFGLGFTKNLSPIIYRLEILPSINKIIVSSILSSKIERTKVTFNTADLEEIFHWIKPFKESQSEALKKVSNNALSKLFPKEIKYNNEKYIKGTLSTYIKNKQISSEKLSTEDIDAVLTVLPDHIAEESLFYKTEEKINFIRLNSVKEEFKLLIKQKTDTKAFEQKCHKFFKENSWIFSNVLSMPVAFLEDKAYVGGKAYDNKAGKEADFLYKNNLTKNVFIVEIKTPLKKIIDTKTPYRKPDIYSLGKELTGGLVQLLDQKDNLQKEYYNLSRGEYTSFNPKVLLVVGLISELNKYQLKSFELFRSNLKDIEIITYDELFDRTNLILGQFIEE